MGPILGVALLAAAAGSVSAAPKSSTASLWACLNGDAVQVHVDWTGYHPDDAVPVAWQGTDAHVASSMDRQTDWKFGNASWDPSTTTWGPTFGPGTMVAVDLYGHGKFIVETNSVDYGSLVGC
jgi:hypothetical protein